MTDLWAIALRAPRFRGFAIAPVPVAPLRASIGYRWRIAMKSLPESQVEALRAVLLGDVKHVHPFNWVYPLKCFDLFSDAALNALLKKRLIQVDAKSTEFHRAVRATDAGEQVFASLSQGGSHDQP